MRLSTFVIVEKSTGKAVAEVWSASMAAKVNVERYKVVPILEWLYSLNAPR
jgi:hypothetical protein